MNTYTEHLVSHCFGRYLIDLPEDMVPAQASGTTLAIAPYSEYSGAIHVTVVPLPKTVFEQNLKRRKTKLENMHIDLHPDWPYLEQSIPLHEGAGVIFNRSENGGSRGARTLELHGWKDGYSIELNINANSVSYPEYADDDQLQELGSTVDQKIHQLRALYERIRGRAKNEIPSGQGACFKNGFVSGPASDTMREDIAMGFVSKMMSDVRFHMETDSGLQTETTLLERLPAIKANVEEAKGRILRSGSTNTKSGLQFDQVLSSGNTSDGHVFGQYFLLEVNSKVGSARSPLVDISFWNGDRGHHDYAKPLTKASLSEAESIGLWNASVATLRKRPGAF